MAGIRAIAWWRAPLRALFPVGCCVMIAGRAGAQEQKRDWVPQAGIFLGSPQRASIAVGALRVLKQSPDASFASGVRLMAEPGLRAGKLRFGLAVTGPFASGYSIEAAAMREWSGHVQADFPRNFYGLEVHGSVMFIDAGIGLYAPGGGSRGRIALSAGLVL